MASFLGDFGINTVRDIAIGQIGLVNVPEPASLALFGLGVLGMSLVRRQNKAG